MAGSVSVRAYDRTQNGRPEHVGAYTRAAPASQDEGIGFGRFGSAGPPPRSGGSIIFIARRRDPLEMLRQRETPLEGGGGVAGPSRSFGNAPSRAPSPRRSAEPRFDI